MFKIKGKLIVIGVALVTIPLIVLGFSLYQIVLREIKSDNEIRLQEQAKLINSNVQNVYTIAKDKVITGWGAGT